MQYAGLLFAIKMLLIGDYFQLQVTMATSLAQNASKMIIFEKNFGEKPEKKIFFSIPATIFCKKQNFHHSQSAL